MGRVSRPTGPGLVSDCQLPRQSARPGKKSTELSKSNCPSRGGLPLPMDGQRKAGEWRGRGGSEVSGQIEQPKSLHAITPTEPENRTAMFLDKRDNATPAPGKWLATRNSDRKSMRHEEKPRTEPICPLHPSCRSGRLARISPPGEKSGLAPPPASLESCRCFAPLRATAAKMPPPLCRVLPRMTGPRIACVNVNRSLPRSADRGCTFHSSTVISGRGNPRRSHSATTSFCKVPSAVDCRA
jgi:hypothetical protein